MAGGIVFDSYCFTQASVAPGTIAANTSAEISVTCNGLRNTDLCVFATKPTLTAGIDIGNARVSAANTLKITYQNSTSSGIAVPTEVYNLMFARPQNNLGGPDALSGGNVIFNSGV